MDIYFLDLEEIKSDFSLINTPQYDDFRKSLIRYGCFYLKNNSIDSEFLSKLTSVTKEFFNNDFNYKKEFIPPLKEIFRGYTSISQESLSQTIGEKNSFDLNESFQIGPYNIPKNSNSTKNFFQYHNNIWPKNMNHFKLVWEEYYKGMELISSELLNLFSELFHVDHHFLQSQNDFHISRLRARFYPKIKSPLAKNQYRVSAHTDYGTFSILHNQYNSRGLQIYDRIKKQWLDVDFHSDYFFINLGDLFEIMSAGIYKAPIHRVIPPNDQISANNLDRLTFIYFHALRYDCVIRPLPKFSIIKEKLDYPETTVADYLRRKLLMANYK